MALKDYARLKSLLIQNYYAYQHKRNYNLIEIFINTEGKWCVVVEVPHGVDMPDRKGLGCFKDKEKALNKARQYMSKH